MQELEDREPLSPRTLLRRLRDWTRQELSVPGEADLEVDDSSLVDDPAAHPRRPPEMRIEIRNRNGNGEPAPLPDVASLPVEATIQSGPRWAEAGPAESPVLPDPPVLSEPNGQWHPERDVDALADRVARLETGMRLLAETLKLAHADVAEAVRGLQSAVRDGGASRGARPRGAADSGPAAGLVSREDLASLATREDLASMATREDLAELATREDLAGLATRQDIERAVSGAAEKLSGALATLTEATTALPSVVGSAAERLGERIDTVRVDVEESLIALLPLRENGHSRQEDIWAPRR